MKIKDGETNYSRGIWAEERAADYLVGQGYEVLRVRYKTKFGEIDIITQKGDMICFVEVKVRESEAQALESITLRSRKRIENSALFFLSENPEFMSCDMRFDVVAIYKSVENDGFDLTHLDNAWEVGS